MMINRRDLSLWKKEAYRAEADEEFMFKSGFGLKRMRLWIYDFLFFFFGSWRIYETFEAFRSNFPFRNESFQHHKSRKTPAPQTAKPTK
jgi:hypothetical protein